MSVKELQAELEGVRKENRKLDKANTGWAKRLTTLQEQLATLQAQLLSMLGPQLPSETPPPHLMTTSASSSNTVAPKAKTVPAPQAPEGDLAAKLAKRRRKD